MAYTRLKVLELENFPANTNCSFCKQNISDELKYGKIYKRGDVVTHYFCMLFSSQMEQNGRDEDGILGFLLSDIKKEITRGSKMECVYCHNEGATINCSAKTCKRTFHFPCGVINEALYQFSGQFRCFCVQHRRPQMVPQSMCKSSETMICVMCQEEVRKTPSVNTIWAPCCKTAWFHKDCIQKMAVNAGYFFKCPNCNNKEEFRKEMPKCGIYIPDQDASWELEPNAFQELNERYSSCDAEICECPRGRDYSPQEGLWEIILCNFCGSQGIHSKCGENSIDLKGQWLCPLCSEVVARFPRSSNEDPGPSEVPTIRTRNRSSDGRYRRSSLTQTRRGRGRRRKINTPPSTSKDTEEVQSRKMPKINDPGMTLETDKPADTTTLFGNSGEPIQVVRLDNIKPQGDKVIEIGGVNVADNIVSLDSDDDESYVDTSKDITVNSRLRNQDSNSTDRSTDMRSLVSERQPVSSRNNTADVIIDLLDDSEDELEQSSHAVQTLNCAQKIRRLNSPSIMVNRNINAKVEDEDDDVIFVRSDIPELNKIEHTSSALIRIVENNRIYEVSPSEIKKRVSSDGNTLVKSTTVTVPSNSVTQSVESSTHNSNDVWQSVPPHKSLVHSFPQSQFLTFKR